jgi:hypothetical protein
VDTRLAFVTGLVGEPVRSRVKLFSKGKRLKRPEQVFSRRAYLSDPWSTELPKVGPSSEYRTIRYSPKPLLAVVPGNSFSVCETRTNHESVPAIRTISYIVGEFLLFATTLFRRQAVPNGRKERLPRHRSDSPPARGRHPPSRPTG